MNTFLHILSFIGSLGLFLYGMKIMSEGLEKLAGDHMRNILGAMTRNRFMGVLTGVVVTDTQPFYGCVDRCCCDRTHPVQ